VAVASPASGVCPDLTISSRAAIVHFGSTAIVAVEGSDFLLEGNLPKARNQLLHAFMSVIVVGHACLDLIAARNTGFGTFPP
jgi:hypothetical protein